MKHILGRHTAVAVGKLVASVLREFLGENITPFAGVLDGGDIASVSETANLLNCKIEERRCICHILNNAVKKLILTFFGDSTYVLDWRTFVSHINFSNSFKELWDETCLKMYNKKVTLQKDCPTRWSSTVVMFEKALSVRNAVDIMKIESPYEHEV